MVCVLYSSQLKADWWRGEGPAGQKGIFPSNYVRKIENSPIVDKAAYGPPQYQPYPQNYPPPAQQYPGPSYAPQYQPMLPPPEQQMPQEQPKESKLGRFGKNYGKTFVNATAWYRLSVCC
jgi:hypothetical protein